MSRIKLGFSSKLISLSITFAICSISFLTAGCFKDKHPAPCHHPIDLYHDHYDCTVPPGEEQWKKQQFRELFRDYS